MKTIWLLLIALIVTSASTASPLCTAFAGPQDVMSPGFSCTLAGFTFDNFELAAPAAGVSPEVDLVSAFGGVGAVLDFRANISQAGSDGLFLSYRVSLSGGVSAFQIPPVNNVTITVTACDAAFNAQTCSGTQLGQVVAPPPDPQLQGPWPSAFIPLTSPIFVLTKINANAGSEGGPAITFSEDFGPADVGVGAGSETPEPTSLVLAGCGLIALVVAQRRCQVV